MNRLRQEIEPLALDLAWSLWAELGVDGAVRRHDWQAIDLEPLIIFTAHLGSADSRLRASTIDWCIANSRFASAFRLRNLADRARPEVRAAFGHFAATVRAHAKAPWPGHGDPLTLFHPERSGSPDLRRPSLVQLRLRALVGVSARAEILKLMLADPDRAQLASTLAEGAAYGKGSVAQSLEMLTLAGIVQVQPQGNRLLYRLTRPGELAQALLWLPSVYPDWWPIFNIVEAVTNYARTASGPASARMAAALTLLREIQRDLNRLGISERVPHAVGPASVVEFEHWALDFVAEQTGAVAAGATPEVSYVIHHLSFGGWIGTINVAGLQPRPLETAEGRFDEPAGAGLLAHMMFRDVIDRGQSPRGEPDAPDDGLLEVISHEFAEELMKPMRAGQEATFTAEFVRRWHENRRQRLGATA